MCSDVLVSGHLGVVEFGAVVEVIQSWAADECRWGCQSRRGRLPPCCDQAECAYQIIRIVLRENNLQHAKWEAFRNTNHETSAYQADASGTFGKLLLVTCQFPCVLTSVLKEVKLISTAADLLEEDLGLEKH